MSMSVRLIGAFVGGCAVALGLSLFAAYLIHVVDDRRDDDMIEAHPVDLLLGYDQLDLKELLGEPRYELPDIAPPPELPEFRPRSSEIRGFVMLSVEVDADGRATDARVLTAEPSGIYEREAVAEALAMSWPAGTPGQRDHVVRFSVSRDSQTEPPLGD